MSNSFYRAFEDRHRGSRELIKSRLSAYLPFISPLLAFHEPAVLDLGCGRGEWLELLGEHGFAARGVDLDEGMLAACRERGLDVHTGDALASLRAQPNASLALVSAFHLVEHIPFDAVQELIQEALRVLTPGGLLIMETPNPENLVVATSGFYMDPSHLRPIPPQLLEFVVEFGGFARHRVVRLQEPAQLHGAAPLELMNVLNGVSPDYSVVAQKAAEPEVSAPFDAAFDMPFGLDLATLAQRYQAQHEQQRGEALAGIAQLSERVAAIELNTSGVFQRTLEAIGEAQSAARLMQVELHATQQRERALDSSLHAHLLRDAESRALQAEQRVAEIRRHAEDAEQRIAEARKAAADAEQEAAQARQRAMDAQLRANDAELRVGDAELRASHAELRATQAERHAEKSLRLLEEQMDPSSENAGQLALEAQQQSAVLLEEAQQARDAAVAHAEHVQWKLNEMTVRLAATEQQVRDILSSSSWRITRPARAMVTLLRRPQGVPVAERAAPEPGKPRSGSVIMPLVRKLAKRPAARAVALRVLAPFPSLEGRLRSLAIRAREQEHGTVSATLSGAAAQLPPGAATASGSLPMSRSAQTVFAQLQRSLHSNDHADS